MTERIEFTELPSSGTVALTDVALWLTPQDNVAIAKVALSPGTVLIHTGGTRIPVRQFIPVGHKIALSDLAPGAPVYRYGQVIGSASAPITAGDHVHTHNVSLQPLERAAAAQDIKPVEYVPEAQRRTFLGFQRETGRAGTRNYIAVIATVNCAAHTCREIAAHFTPDRLAAFPNVDGVIPLTHTIGCTDRVGSLNYVVLQRTLAGMALHPNVAGFVVVGLGCEVNQVAELVENYQLSGDQAASLVIQDRGGVRKTVAAGIAAVERLLERANTYQRSPQPVSDLAVALQCGGSDSWSGITANPVIGLVTDELVRQGGTGVLGEMPEIYGAEHLLIQRATQPDVAQKIRDKIVWWQHYTALFGLEINNNPSTGNKAGGLTTIFEKSLGAVAKGGHTPLVAVCDYAEPVTTPGLVMMDTPGYDPVAVTGQVAGGCNLVLFSTGRGSVFGFAPAPSIKIATNTRLFEHMLDDMDFNTGRVLDGDRLEDAAADLFELLLAVASGQPSKSEAQGVGACEFVPWLLGPVL
jgi:altronate dehydratase